MQDKQKINTMARAIISSLISFWTLVLVRVLVGTLIVYRNRTKRTFFFCKFQNFHTEFSSILDMALLESIQIVPLRAFAMGINTLATVCVCVSLIESLIFFSFFFSLFQSKVMSLIFCCHKRHLTVKYF
jgi:hypothetical protein